MSRHHKRREDREDKQPEAEHVGAVPEPDAAKGALIVKGVAGGVVLSGDAVTAESLPVLNALREFIEMERRRTRNRMIALGATFIVLFLIAAAAGFWMARRHWERMRQEFAAERQESQAVIWRTESNVAEVAVTTDRLRTEFTRERESSRHAESQLVARVAGSTEEVRGMKDTVAALEIENAMLNYTVRDIRSNFASTARADSGAIEQQLALLREELAVDRVLADQAEAQEAAITTSAPPSNLQIAPTNAGRPVKFRLPLPQAESGPAQ